MMFCLAACSDDARTAWTSVLKKCAVSDLTGSSIMYFGPSNAIGPGSIWRKDDDGSFRLRYALSDMPDPKAFFKQQKEFQCDGSAETKFSLKAAAGLSSSISPMSADLSNDFQKAKSITVKANSARWDLVSEGPYENYIDSLPSGNGAKTDLKEKAGRFVMYQALLIKGFSAELEFSDSDVASLKGKYSGAIAKSITGDLTASLDAQWSSDNKLTLTSTDDFYVAGQLVPFSATGWAAGGGSRFGKPEDLGSKPVITRENP
ncbi:MAG: putative lipoprotein [Nevskia sp.]|nr:putative lipoprotein [Nevskia sp.]